jgi:hypothetical protein
VFPGHVHFESLPRGRYHLTNVTADPGGNDVLALNVRLDGGVEAGGVAAAGAGPHVPVQPHHHRADQVVENCKQNS